MKHEHALFDTNDEAAEADADARAAADIQNGRVIGHQAVKRWIASWGSEAPLPRPHVAG